MKGLLVLLVSIVSSFIVLLGIDTKNQETTVALDTTSVYAISKMRSEVDSINTNLGGICDTCITAYKAVIVENRMLANELSAQNYEMQQIIEKNKKLLHK